MALADNALVSLADAKAYLGVGTSGDDALIERLINAESSRIERYCDRNFRKQSYRESYNGSGQRRLRLRNYPVIGISRVAIGNKIAFSVSSDTASDLRSVVEVRSDRLILTRHQSDGTKTTSNLVFASANNDTASGLVDAINAVSGFDATLLTNCLSVDLFRQGGVNVMLSTAQIEFPDRDDIPYRVHDDRATLEFVASADMLFFGKHTDAGLPMPHTFGGILVEYDAGFDGLSEIPADLAQACIELVQFAYSNKAENPTMQSESIGSYSYTRAADPIRSSDRIRELLAQFVDRKS
jgi:hypothetical protein